MDAQRLKEIVKTLVGAGFSRAFVTGAADADLEAAFGLVTRNAEQTREDQEREMARKMGLTYEQFQEGKQ